MTRLFTFCLSLICLVIVVWFGVTVDLGERTLFGHLRAIGSSREAQALWDGARAKLGELMGMEAGRAKGEPVRPPRVERTPAGPPQEDLRPKDRKQMQDQLQRILEARSR